MTPARAALYVRISDDRDEDDPGAGTSRQESDARALADRLGWGVGEVITENDTSAFKRRAVGPVLADGRRAMRVVRPGFRRLLDMLESGEADGMLAYDLDRVARDPRDLEDLIEAVEGRRVPVESVTGSLKLATDADVFMARILVNVANKSSRDTSRRVARKHEELAAAGKPGGGGARAYGYHRDGRTVHPDEAPVVVEMAAKLLAGWSMNAVAADLNARGVPTARGGRWQSRSVRSIVTGPRVAGLRTFDREVVGEAAWPAILDRDTWTQVRAEIARRGKGPGNTLRRWLTGVLRCSRCEAALTGWQGPPKASGPNYWCATPRGGCGRVSVRAAPAEAEIERQVLDYLAHPMVLARLRAASSAGNLAGVRRDAADDEAQLTELARMWAGKRITLAEYTEARAVIDARLRQARVFLTSAAPSAVRTVLAADDVRAGWGQLTPAGKRDVVLAVVAGYEVRPHDRARGPVFDPNRLVPIPHTDDG